MLINVIDQRATSRIGVAGEVNAGQEADHRAEDY
jgi:hypothetical protein